MISFSRIGNFGRLGNQMFQFASTYGVANKLGYEVKFPINFDVPKIFKIDDSLLCPIEDLNNLNNVGEDHFHFYENLFKIPDNSNLNGYYQTEKYFSHCEDQIKKLFTFKTHVIEESKLEKDKINSFFGNLELVSIHVRLGDYVNLQDYHTVQSSEYYTKAIEHFIDKQYGFVVFSDDIETCKKIFPPSFYFSESNKDYVDLYLMSNCSHNIIANSTFSWWAACLNSNENKKIIAPKNWFGPAYSYNITKDLYCKDWIIK
jgi:hypothetical protein